MLVVVGGRRRPCLAVVKPPPHSTNVLAELHSDDHSTDQYVQGRHDVGSIVLIPEYAKPD